MKSVLDNLFEIFRHELSLMNIDMQPQDKISNLIIKIENTYHVRCHIQNDKLLFMCVTDKYTGFESIRHILHGLIVSNDINFKPLIKIDMPYVNVYYDGYEWCIVICDLHVTNNWDDVNDDLSSYIQIYRQFISKFNVNTLTDFQDKFSKIFNFDHNFKNYTFVFDFDSNTKEVSFVLGRDLLDHIVGAHQINYLFHHHEISIMNKL